MALKKVIPFLSFFMAAGVFATGEINIRIELGDGTLVNTQVSLDLTAEKAIEQALSKKVPSIPKEDYELYNLSTRNGEIDRDEKLLNYTNYSWLNLKQ